MKGGSVLRIAQWCHVQAVGIGVALARAMTVDHAKPRDIPAMIGLLDVLFSIEQDFRPDHPKQRRGLRMLLQNPQTATVLVARDESGKVIGMVTGQLVISTAEGAPSVWVEDIVVASVHRGQGVGRTLVRAILEWARGRGATRAQLLCDIDNAPAMAFYDQQGWRPTRLAARRWQPCGTTGSSTAFCEGLPPVPEPQR